MTIEARYTILGTFSFNRELTPDTTLKVSMGKKKMEIFVETKDRVTLQSQSGSFPQQRSLRYKRDEINEANITAQLLPFVKAKITHKPWTKK